MDFRLFTLDKNYLLKEAQFQQKNQLLLELVTRVRNTYLHEYNPLGLKDEVIETLIQPSTPRLECLYNFYFELAGIYRFKYGENQLEFLFDGTPHIEKYRKDWQRHFRKWSGQFCRQKHFLRAILEGTILNPDQQTDYLIEIRLKHFLEQHFGLRIYKYRGIRKIQVA
ncbi:MAG: hypothetical protein KFF73_17395 [Cyclobacteriaceae bacterium]|nr:hypothetical protein [Cyclobacteriaceae bacterium]